MCTKERTKQDSGGRDPSSSVEAGNHPAVLGEEESPQPALEHPCCGQKQGVRKVEEDDTALI